MRARASRWWWLPLLGAAALLPPGAARAAPDEEARSFLARAQQAAAAMPAPACIPARADAAGLVAAHPLPARIPGAAAGTTGGLGHRLLVVTAGEDDRGSARRPGTLRWAVETARREGGGWIAFAPALAGQAIALQDGLRPGSNTTIDGGCGGITLHAPARATTLRIADASNIIVSGLAFEKSAHVEPDDRTGDAIGIADGADRIAILNNAFARCGDGCVDVVRRAAAADPMRVTIAFNRIGPHNKVMLVGALVCTAQRSLPACARPLDALEGALRPTMRVSLVANLFLGTSQRHPKAVATSFVHSVNNVIDLAPTPYADGRTSATYGAAAASGGIIASDGDIFVNRDSRRRLGIGPVSAARQSPGAEEDGAVAISGAVAIGAIDMVAHAPAVARAQHAAPVAVLDTAGGGARVAACVFAMAGPQGAARAWPGSCDRLRSDSSVATTLAANPDQSARASAAPRP